MQISICSPQRVCPYQRGSHLFHLTEALPKRVTLTLAELWLGLETQCCLAKVNGCFASDQVTPTGGLVSEYPPNALNSGLGIVIAVICPCVPLLGGCALWLRGLKWWIHPPFFLVMFKWDIHCNTLQEVKCVKKTWGFHLFSEVVWKLVSTTIVSLLNNLWVGMITVLFSDGLGTAFPKSSDGRRNRGWLKWGVGEAS